MSFTEKQARGKAQQIFDRFGRLIRRACAGTGVEESFLAGFTGVEAGIDRQGNISPTATRFEPGVYQDLISLRDNGYCFVGGKRMTNYSAVRQSQIADADDAAIRALATSYSFSQIMGWHCINNLKCTVAELKDPDKHFGYTVKLLKIVGGAYMTRGDLTSVLHIWNTGNANGKTYHAAYVDNALLVKKHYESILAKRGHELDVIETDSAVGSQILAQPNNVSPQLPAMEPAAPSSPAQPPTNEADGFVAEKFAVFLPQIDTAKTWIRRAVAGTTVGAIGSRIAGMPEWMQIFLFSFVGIVLVGAIVIFALYHRDIFAYVTKMNTLRATADAHDPVISASRPD